ncbi:hypothetical protein OYC64_019685 [Pagothenia borchgrevinki]|uniref:Uncharacterized protein n=1 Tax=Pagothenia borchgrevinki TaxID=8213 RepID=A0ABD2FIW6_PAGBO
MRDSSTPFIGLK